MQPIPLSELYDAISRFVQVGMMEAVKAYEPAGDLLRRSELKEWLRVAYVDADAFRRLEKSGLVKAVKRGNAPNSLLLYSKKEVKQALATLKLASLIDKYHDHFTL